MTEELVYLRVTSLESEAVVGKSAHRCQALLLRHSGAQESMELSHTKPHSDRDATVRRAMQHLYFKDWRRAPDYDVGDGSWAFVG